MSFVFKVYQAKIESLSFQMAESTFVLDSYVNISDDTYETGMNNWFWYFNRAKRWSRER